MHRISSKLRRIVGWSVGAVLVTLLFFSGIATAPAEASVENFSFDRWQVDMSVSQSDDGTSEASVQETVVANFDVYNQNKGIVRSIPQRYEGASIDISDVHVTDAAGKPSPFETESADGNLRILTGTDEYVNGRQTYVITYTLKNVIHNVQDDKRGKIDELYWNLLPADRAQPVNHFSATIDFDDTLKNALTGHEFCYAGTEGSNGSCEITNSGSKIQVPSTQLREYEGLTVAIGLENGTVKQPMSRAVSRGFFAVFPYVTAATVLTLISGWVVRFIARRRGRKSGDGLVVAQYDVPLDLPPAAAAWVVNKPKSSFQAQIVHLAVNGALVIQDLVSPGETGLTLVKRDITVPTIADKLVMEALFRAGPSIDVVKGSPNKVLMAASKDNQKSGLQLAEEHHLVTHKVGKASMWLGLATLLLGIFPIIGFFLGVGAVWFVVPLLGFFLFKKNTVLTPAGARTREYLLGVREFIAVAEAERFQMLQSYQGADRLSNGDVDVVHIYEKLLPYAILFGQEKSWAKNLEVVYQQTNTSPYAWAPAFHSGGVSGLSNGLSVFGSSLSSASTSSSSGSSGGGSVGGGGGGGSAGGR